ncbi:hypothetical protein BLA29_011535 [Euroglyphus maynei]|uniref:Uncharacterized protein n=1 Tax=Euroglyphus maynei TaxID=6958 RepID=A0A1Y3BGD2_EURMA|nr:hypothetical protein BLA29_011535 [Euroglyphus maynei]
MRMISIGRVTFSRRPHIMTKPGHHSIIHSVRIERAIIFIWKVHTRVHRIKLPDFIRPYFNTLRMLPSPVFNSTITCMAKQSEHCACSSRRNINGFPNWNRFGKCLAIKVING